MNPPIWRFQRRANSPSCVDYRTNLTHFFISERSAHTAKKRLPANTKELVSLKIDSDVLAHFQAGGQGWQERINDTLRAAMNVSN
ncbi:hypothetical protein EM858_14795 [Agrobacterium sp. CNPSo 2736]|nr:hypothetical protein EM858_14795 [Agrobacterium sp. CNPSo 2736]TKV73132.1 hypothetical protein D0C28_21700 [Rhizobium sp. AU243]